MNDHLLIARELYKSYRLGNRQIDVLSGINLQVLRKEAVIIIGASGAGKSTLLHLLGGIDSPSSGEVVIEDRSLYSMSQSDRTKLRNETVGFVFQSYNLLPELDALENICIPSLLRGCKSAELKVKGMELLKAVGLADRSQHRPAELSGGEQQRVAIARALINRPKLLLADEPTGNLDSKTGESILDLLWNLRSLSETSLVLVTHDQQIARRGDRVLEIADGKILQ